ncbi:MAG: FtsW/RodA/SpoVE family cell cycle protein [Oscillospiraceae bacterium]|nr:FtsW/RodA/SpoVE family cell cycle protein [Oscillospiraceae bacterium]MBR4193694.1 FtsW/RodA/SpoVE family cell cycle protein [Oscillospiraceae bacterium]
MRRIWNGLTEFFKRGDLLLLFLCVVATVFGIVMIASATRYSGSSRYLVVQSASLLLGILIYIAMSLLDIEILAEHRELLLAFNVLLISMLLIWGVGDSVGNRAWLDLPLMPVYIQPAEICKITFVIAMAKTMSNNRSKISSVRSVASIAIQAVMMIGLIVVISRDVGSALVFLFIFLVVAFVGGVRSWWFLAAFLAAAALSPLLWKYFFSDNQKLRILVPFDPTIDPDGTGVRWDTNRSIAMLSGGGISGQGLFKGTMLGVHAIAAQHTDFIFSAIGEELGILGCLFTLLLLLAIVGRCIWVGMHTPNYMNRLICIGIAAMLVFQIMINVGMCIGILPVIGLTLPFISYGGSSIITVFLAMGVVSGIHMRPDPEAKSPYIQPRY